MVFVKDTLRGGIFEYKSSGYTVDNGIVFSATGGGYWVRKSDYGDPIIPQWWGMKDITVDTTFDNAGPIQLAINYAALSGKSVLLNSKKSWGIKSTVYIKSGVRFVIGMGDRIYSYTSGLKMFVPEPSSQFFAYGDGAITLNDKTGTGVFLDGPTYDYGNAKGQPIIDVNILGDILSGQNGLYLLADGGSIYGTGSASYIRNIHIAGNSLDTAILVKAINRGNANNNEFHFLGGKNIHGIVFLADTMSAGAGATSIAGNVVFDNITSAEWTATCIALYGNSKDNYFKMKIEDYGRHLDSNSVAAVYLDQYTKTNTLELGTLRSGFVTNMDPSNNITTYRSDATSSNNLYGNHGVYPFGPTNNPGGNESNYLLGAHQKPWFTVSSNSVNNTTNDLKKIFDANLNSTWTITDANTVAKTLYIKFRDTVKYPQAMQVIFDNYKHPRYYKVEARSADSAKWYTVFETDTTNSNSSSPIITFKDKLIYYGIRTKNKNGTPITDTFKIAADLTDMDSLKITVKGNNWVNAAPNIYMSEVWMVADKINPVAYPQIAGGNDTFYQKINFKAGLDMNNQTLENAVFPSNNVIKNWGNIGNFDALNIMTGMYTYNNTTTGVRPTVSGTGSVLLMNNGASNFHDGLSKAQMIAFDGNLNRAFIRFWTTSSWSAWDTLPTFGDVRAGFFPLTGGALTGTAGSGYVEFPAQSSAASTPTSGFRFYADASGRLSWKGTNGFFRTIDGTANTANRTYTLPDASVTLMGLENAQSVTGAKTFDDVTTIIQAGSGYATNTWNVKASNYTTSASYYTFNGFSAMTTGTKIWNDIVGWSQSNSGSANHTLIRYTMKNPNSGTFAQGSMYTMELNAISQSGAVVADGRALNIIVQDNVTGIGTFTNSYGSYISQNATSGNKYGYYQGGTATGVINYFNGGLTVKSIGDGVAGTDSLLVENNGVVKKISPSYYGLGFGTVTAGKLLGRYSATSGPFQELTVGSGLQLDNSTGVLSVSATFPSIGNFMVTLGNATIAASTSQYCSLNQTLGNTEGARAMVIPYSGTLKNLYVYAGGNQPATGNLIVTLRKGTAGGSLSSTALTLTIAASAAAGTGKIYTDLVNSVTVNAGDIISFQFTNNATTTSLTLGAFSFIIQQ